MGSEQPSPIDYRGREGILRQIDNPLGFFALALLISEGFLTVAIFPLRPEDRYNAFLALVIVLVVVIAAVLFLTIRFPDNLSNARLNSKVAQINVEVAAADRRLAQMNTVVDERLDQIKKLVEGRGGLQDVVQDITEDELNAFVKDAVFRTAVRRLINDHVKQASLMDDPPGGGLLSGHGP